MRKAFAKGSGVAVYVNSVRGIITNLGACST
jgi:hypothetical protein